jgi:hypothetical protein
MMDRPMEVTSDRGPVYMPELRIHARVGPRSLERLHHRPPGLANSRRCLLTPISIEAWGRTRRPSLQEPMPKSHYTSRWSGIRVLAPLPEDSTWIHCEYRQPRRPAVRQAHHRSWRSAGRKRTGNRGSWHPGAIPDSKRRDVVMRDFPAEIASLPQPWLRLARKQGQGGTLKFPRRGHGQQAAAIAAMARGRRPPQQMPYFNLFRSPGADSRADCGGISCCPPAFDNRLHLAEVSKRREQSPCASLRTQREDAIPRYMAGFSPTRRPGSMNHISIPGHIGHRPLTRLMSHHNNTPAHRAVRESDRMPLPAGEQICEVPK